MWYFGTSRASAKQMAFARIWQQVSFARIILDILCMVAGLLSARKYHQFNTAKEARWFQGRGDNVYEEQEKG